MPEEVLDDRFLGGSNLFWYDFGDKVQCLDRRASTLRAGLSPFVVLDALKYKVNNLYNG